MIKIVKIFLILISNYHFGNMKLVFGALLWNMNIAHKD